MDDVHSQVAAAISRACAALHEGDMASAKRDLEAVADVALRDQQAADRLQLWQLFVSYAEAWSGYRDQALHSAATGSGEFELGEVKIAVVELTPQEFIYRDSRRPGRNLRVPRDAIPPDIEEAIVRSWFNADGRAANHLFLGAAALCRPTPDLDAARRDWETAASRGEDHGRLLLGILDDPAIRGVPPAR